MIQPRGVPKNCCGLGFCRGGVGGGGQGLALEMDIDIHTSTGTSVAYGLQSRCFNTGFGGRFDPL